MSGWLRRGSCDWSEFFQFVMLFGVSGLIGRQCSLNEGVRERYQGGDAEDDLPGGPDGLLS